MTEPILNEQDAIPRKNKAFSKKFFLLLCTACFIVALLFGFIFLAFLSSSPHFPEGEVTLQVEPGMSVRNIVLKAKEMGVVRSSLYLYILLTYSNDPTAIYAGTYRFTEPSSVFEVAKKLANSDVDHTLITITIPEGVTRKDIANIAKNRIQDFDDEKFLELTKNTEGLLFPETYFVSPSFTAEEFVDLLTKTFTTRLLPYKDRINNSHFSEYEVLILASILEREANDEQSMRMVSGILQNRLKIGMALQTDASIQYVLDKPLYELLPSDLEIDTPYNTYLYSGLPPTPIGNPGEQAIMAVLDPIASGYMFYITGSDGKFYYAKTFDEHKINVERYLR